MHKVSVLMPVYNCKAFIIEAIESILNQTFTDFELLIIDDVSTDGTYELIKTIADPRIKLLRKNENSGITNSLNMGVDMATGIYIARMDGDDISLPERLEKQVAFLDANPGIAVCGTWFELFPAYQIKMHPARPEDIRAELLNECALGHPTVMIRKAFLEEHQLRYDPEMELAEDYDLWVRIAMNGKLANIPEVLLKYRTHSTQISNTKAVRQSQKTFETKVKLLENITGRLTADENKNAQKLFSFRSIDRLKECREILAWADGLIALNKTKRFFDEAAFAKSMERIKSRMIRNFYLNRKRYDMKSLLHLLEGNIYLNKYLTFCEKLKVIFKSVIFWKQEHSNIGEFNP